MKEAPWAGFIWVDASRGEGPGSTSWSSHWNQRRTPLHWACVRYTQVCSRAESQNFGELGPNCRRVGKEVDPSDHAFSSLKPSAGVLWLLGDIQFLPLRSFTRSYLICSCFALQPDFPRSPHLQVSSVHMLPLRLPAPFGFSPLQRELYQLVLIRCFPVLLGTQHFTHLPYSRIHAGISPDLLTVLGTV